MLTAEQLTERQSGLGGSDASAALGLSRWKTPLDLYYEKRGESAPIAESEPMRWGNLLEPLVRQEYAERTGRVVRLPTETLRHPTHPFLLAHPDGVTDDRRLYEGKTARFGDGWGEPGTDEIPQEYLIQVQHYLLVLDLPVADVAVLIGGSDFRLYEVPADAELHTMLLDAESEFWNRVVTGEPPPPKTIEDVKRRFRASRPGSVEASAEILAAVERLRLSKAHVADLATQAEADHVLIQAAMGELESLTHDGRTLATWKSAKGANRFDTAAFKAAHAELYLKFLAQSEPTRRFLLKS